MSQQTDTKPDFSLMESMYQIAARNAVALPTDGFILCKDGVMRSVVDEPEHPDVKQFIDYIQSQL